MARTLFVGDVHACADELSDLLNLVAISAEDRVVLVGDLVGRGPLPQQAVRVARQVGAKAVRGNHEAHFLRWRSEGPRDSSPPGAHERRRRQHAAELGEEDWAYLESFPLWLNLPEHGVLVVHAGLQPGVTLEQQPAEVLLTIRCLTPAGEPSSRRGDDLWARGYTGPPHVIFGHHALDQPQLHAWATGLDTGCVYGGRLTGLLLPADTSVPARAAERRAALVSVPARRAYEPIER